MENSVRILEKIDGLLDQKLIAGNKISSGKENSLTCPLDLLAHMYIVRVRGGRMDVFLLFNVPEAHRARLGGGSRIRRSSFKSPTGSEKLFPNLFQHQHPPALSSTTDIHRVSIPRGPHSSIFRP